NNVGVCPLRYVRSVVPPRTVTPDTSACPTLRLVAARAVEKRSACTAGVHPRSSARDQAIQRWGGGIRRLLLSNLRLACSETKQCATHQQPQAHSTPERWQWPG